MLPVSDSTPDVSTALLANIGNTLIDIRKNTFLTKNALIEQTRETSAEEAREGIKERTAIEKPMAAGASGTAEVFQYDHNTNILTMENNAWVNNGSNEVSGNLITYNLVKRSIIADSENGSPVKLIIDSTSIN